MESAKKNGNCKIIKENQFEEDENPKKNIDINKLQLFSSK